MSEIEKMKRYIELTNMKESDRFRMSMWELLELGHQAQTSNSVPLETISFAFEYGKAKGYRAAKAEVRR